MRVICIDEDSWPDNIPVIHNDGKIKNGEAYEVTKVYLEDGYIWFEVSIDPNWGYWENCFARTSNIDEL
jgi:hypothetical protein